MVNQTNRIRFFRGGQFDDQLEARSLSRNSSDHCYGTIYGQGLLQDEHEEQAMIQ